MRTNVEIQELKINDSEYDSTLKILQYADDMTLFIKNSKDLLLAIADIERFGSLTGLQLNKNKSYGMWVGCSSRCTEAPGDINWVVYGENIKILGIYFNSELESSLISKNWTEKINKVKRMIKKWHKRNISLYGKIIIAKTFLISQFTYLMQSLALPVEVLNEIDTLIFKFLWQKKYSETKANEKIKRSILCRKVSDGGLNMISIKTQQKVFYLKWLKKRFAIDTDHKCSVEKQLTQYFFSKLGGLEYFLEAPAYDTKKEDICNSFFWSKVSETWSELSKTILTLDEDKNDILIQPLFHNNDIKYKGNTLFFKKWLEKGIFRIQHITTLQNGKYVFKSFKELQHIIGIDAQLMFQYNAMNNAIPPRWKYALNYLNNTHTVNKTGLINKQIHTFIQLTKQNSMIIRERIENFKNTMCNENFWKRRLDIDITKKYIIANNATQESRLRLLHFKILHNIYPTNHLLFKMKLRSNVLCENCQVPDFIEHFFVECESIRNFWNHISSYIKSSLNVSITLSTGDIQSFPNRIIQLI